MLSAYLVCLMLLVDCLIGLDSRNIINKRWARICEYVSCGPGQSLSCKKSFWLAPLSDGKVSCFQAYRIMVAVPFYADVAVVYDMTATSLICTYCALMMWRCCSQGLPVASLMPRMHEFGDSAPQNKVYSWSVTIAHSLPCLYKWASHELPNYQHIILDKSAAW